MASRILRSHKLQHQAADQLKGEEKEPIINNPIKTPRTSRKCLKPPMKNTLITKNPPKTLLTFSRRGRPCKTSLPNYKTTLTPPSRSAEFQTGETYLKVLQGASFVLIFKVLVASDSKQMIDLSSKTFAYLDSINVDYQTLYNAICSLIHLQCEKEDLQKQKGGPSFVMKSTHEQAKLTFSEVKVTKSKADKDVEDVEREVVLLKDEVELKEQELKKVKEEMERREIDLFNARENKVAFNNGFLEAQRKLLEVSGKMTEAQVVIDRVEKQWSDTVEGIKRAKEELLRMSV